MPILSKAAAQERKERIVDLAERLFVQDGYENTTVDDIVQKLGLAKGTYYYHFNSKEALMIAVSEKLILNTTRKLIDVARQKDQDIVWRIRTVLKTYQEDFYRNKAIWRQVYHWRNAALYSCVAHISAKRFNPILEELLSEANSTGAIAVPHPREAAESLLVLFEMTSRQLCGKADRARKSRLYNSLRYALRQLLSAECIPPFTQ